MKEVFKHYIVDILIVAGFIIFSFVYPVKILSQITGIILTVVLLYTVTNDERIKDPYSTILGIIIFIGAGILFHRIW